MSFAKGEEEASKRNQVEAGNNGQNGGVLGCFTGLLSVTVAAVGGLALVGEDGGWRPNLVNSCGLDTERGTLPQGSGIH